VLLYTDGLSEARNPAEDEYGEARLEKLVRDCQSLPVAELVGAACMTLRSSAPECRCEMTSRSWLSAALGPLPAINATAFKKNGSRREISLPLFILSAFHKTTVWKCLLRCRHRAGDPLAPASPVGADRRLALGGIPPRLSSTFHNARFPFPIALLVVATRVPTTVRTV